LPLFRGFDFN
jgi:hypothetical protein